MKLLTKLIAFLLLVSATAYGQPGQLVPDCPTVPPGTKSEKVENGVVVLAPMMTVNQGAPKCIYTNYNGRIVNEPHWNGGQPINCAPSDMTLANILSSFYRSAEDYSPFEVTWTTDPAVFATYPVNSRLEVVITPTNSFFPGAGGVAWVGSFGSNTVCFVFTNMLAYAGKYVGECISHESGHTVGLWHQSTWSSSCQLTATYDLGSGLQLPNQVGRAPIMGNSYYMNQTTWRDGTTNQGCNITQDNLAIIANTLPYRLPANGVILPGQTNTHTFNLTQQSLVTVRAISGVPGYNVGNTDIKLQIGSVISNNPDSLNTTLVGTFNAGPQELKVSGTSNPNNPTGYGSCGQYTLEWKIEPITIVPITEETRYRTIRTGDFTFKNNIITYKGEGGELINPLGQVLYKNQKRIDISHLRNGVYFFKTYFNTYKIIKQH